MLKIHQNPDGSHSFGQYDRDESIKQDIEKRIEKAERMARYGADPNQIKKYWKEELDPLYHELEDPDRKVISKAFLEGIIDITPEGQERIEKMNEIYKAQKAKAKLLPKVEPKKLSPKKKEREPVVAANAEELKKAVIAMGGSEAEARKESIQDRFASHFKRGKTLKVHHSPGSRPSYAILLN